MTDPPVYVCKIREDEVILSGRGSDPMWSLADEVLLVDPVTGDRPRQRTSVGILAGGPNLYVLFECEDDDVRGTLTERNSPVFTEDCVELFISPSGSTRHYYEINLNPLNTVYDSFVLNGRSRDLSSGRVIGLTDYTCDGLRTMVSVDNRRPGGWKAEYCLPFRSLIGHDHPLPQPGDAWGLNLCRVDTHEAGEQELASWSVLGVRGFHFSWRFGRLCFI